MRDYLRHFDTKTQFLAKVNLINVEKSTNDPQLTPIILF